MKRAKHPRKSLIAASYPGLVISNARVNRSNLHVKHTFLYIVVRADDSLRTKFLGCILGALHSTKTLETLETAAIGTVFSRLPETFSKCESFNKKF